MALTGIISQAFLTLSCGALLLLPSYTDERLALLLAALALTSLMVLLERSRLMPLPLAAFALLCFFRPALSAFWPAVIYVCLFRLSFAWLVPLALISLVYCAPYLGPSAILLLFLAPLLRWKDEELAGLTRRLFRLRDDAAERSQAQQSELAALQRAQEAGVKLAIAEERNRIARDIHDNVGHILGRSILQVTALSLAPRDEAQRQALYALRDSLSSGMNAVRRSVHNTAQDAVYLDQEIRGIVEGFTFCPVSYSNQCVHDLALNKKYVLIAAIKEALSNVMRHSNATRVEIRLSEAAGAHVLLISDNGSLRRAASGGLGLSAMEERVRGLGGSLHIAADKGFRILIRLPMEG